MIGNSANGVEGTRPQSNFNSLLLKCERVKRKRLALIAQSHNSKHSKKRRIEHVRGVNALVDENVSQCLLTAYI